MPRGRSAWSVHAGRFFQRLLQTETSVYIEVESGIREVPASWFRDVPNNMCLVDDGTDSLFLQCVRFTAPHPIDVDGSRVGVCTIFPTNRVDITPELLCGVNGGK